MCSSNVRSGSDLLENILDAHHNIWSLGRSSVFAGHLQYVLPVLLEITSLDTDSDGQHEKLAAVLADYGEFVLKEMSILCFEATGNYSQHIVDSHWGNIYNLGIRYSLNLECFSYNGFHIYAVCTLLCPFLSQRYCTWYFLRQSSSTSIAIQRMHFSTSTQTVHWTCTGSTTPLCWPNRTQIV